MDRLYKLRYVIPKEEQALPTPYPDIFFRNSTLLVTTASDFTDTIPNATVLRNLRILKSVDRDSNSGVTTVVSEKPHDLMVGDRVLLRNIKSSGNTVGAQTLDITSEEVLSVLQVLRDLKSTSLMILDLSSLMFPQETPVCFHVL